MKQEKRYDIFISYRRDGGEYTAKILRDRLKELHYNVFFDVESLRSGDFNTKLYSVIEECTDFLVVLSPNALDRCVDPDDWVRREIEYALSKGKNIVPILMRGFDFPDVLPPSIEPLRFKNGLQSNTQFFDAFLEKLCAQFLLSKPRRKPLALWKTALVALLALALAVGGFFGVRRYKSLYPRTQAQYALTEELLYCAESNLTAFSEFGKALDQAIKAGKRYLGSGAQDKQVLESAFTLAENRVTGFDLAPGKPSDQLLGRLADSPVSGADLTAMYDQACAFQTETLRNIQQLRTIIQTDTGLAIPASSKLYILECYENYLAEELKYFALNANDLLLPLRDKALEPLWYVYMQTVDNLPLDAASWLSNKEQITAGIEASLWNMGEIIRELSLQVGSVGYTSMDDLIAAIAAAEAEDDSVPDIEACDELTVSLLCRAEAADLQVRIDRAEAEGRDASALIERRDDLLVVAHADDGSFGDVRSALRAAEGDSDDVLYAKLKALLGYHYDATALECLDAFGEAVATTAPELAPLIPKLRLFISEIGETGYRYGMLVSSTDVPDCPPNELYRAGDIIVEFDGKDCHSLEEYSAWKAALPGDAFTVTVLRETEPGALERLELPMRKDMSPVYMMQISDWYTELKQAEE